MMALGRVLIDTSAARTSQW